MRINKDRAKKMSAKEIAAELLKKERSSRKLKLGYFKKRMEQVAGRKISLAEFHYAGARTLKYYYEEERWGKGPYRKGDAMDRLVNYMLSVSNEELRRHRDNIIASRRLRDWKGRREAWLRKYARKGENL